MENYEPNTTRYKKEKELEEKKIEKVVKGTVKTRKKSGINKFMSNIVSEDISSIKTFIFKDVIVPSVKKAISDTVEVMLFGDSRRNRSNASKVSYRSYYDEPRQSRAALPSPSYTYDDIILESRGEAEEVLSTMNEILDTYGVVSIGDLYDMLGMTSNYTDQKYGWTNIRGAEVIRVRDGFWLKMPKAISVK